MQYEIIFKYKENMETLHKGDSITFHNIHCVSVEAQQCYEFPVLFGFCVNLTQRQ